MEKIYTKLANRNISDVELKNFMNFLLKVDNRVSEDELTTNVINQRDQMINLYQAGHGAELSRGTLWGALQGVVEYADYHKIYRKGEQLQSIWFGTSAQIKQHAFNLAVDVLDQEVDLSKLNYATFGKNKN